MNNSTSNLLEAWFMMEVKVSLVFMLHTSHKRIFTFQLDIYSCFTDLLILRIFYEAQELISKSSDYKEDQGKDW